MIIKRIKSWLLTPSTTPYYTEQGHRRYINPPVPFHYLPRQGN